MAQPHLLPGAHFGDYQILSELGGGGMGRVYRAQDLTLQRIVAIKTLSSDFSDDPIFVQRFLNEARAAARLNHPNIVQIYSLGIVEQTNYIAMEFVDGSSLGASLKTAMFPEKEAILIIRQAARALAVAHAEGLVHRDIKPDNIMLTQKGDVKIVDLGIAKRIDDNKSLTQPGQAVGTPAYTSPEQVQGEADVDARADIYSLGATLYHMVTGQPPYSGATSTVVMIKHIMEPVPDPRSVVSDLSPGLCHVIARMMAKRREDRYPDALTLERDLYRAQLGMDLHEETRILAKPSGKIVEPPRTAMRPMAQPPAPPPPDRSVAAQTAAAPMLSSLSVTPQRVTSVGFTIGNDDLRFLETELARHVGPLARVLVKGAMKNSGNVEDALAKLEAEITTEPGRRAFRSAVKRLREW